jgi:hypothetical protein
MNDRTVGKIEEKKEGWSTWLTVMKRGGNSFFDLGFLMRSSKSGSFTLISVEE